MTLWILLVPPNNCMLREGANPPVAQRQIWRNHNSFDNAAIAFAIFQSSRRHAAYVLMMEASTHQCHDNLKQFPTSNSECKTQGTLVVNVVEMFLTMYSCHRITCHSGWCWVLSTSVSDILTSCPSTQTIVLQCSNVLSIAVQWNSIGSVTSTKN